MEKPQIKIWLTGDEFFQAITQWLAVNRPAEAKAVAAAVGNAPGAVGFDPDGTLIGLKFRAR